MKNKSLLSSLLLALIFVIYFFLESIEPTAAPRLCDLSKKDFLTPEIDLQANVETLSKTKDVFVQKSIVSYCEKRQTFGSHLFRMYRAKYYFNQNMPDDALREVDNLVHILARRERSSSNLFIYGKLIEFLADRDFYRTQKIKQIVLASMEEAKKISKFEADNIWLRGWLNNLNRNASILSISPQLIDFFENHSELREHNDFWVRFSSVNIMCTYFWTFNKIAKCLQHIEKLQSALSVQERMDHSNEIKVQLLVAKYMNGEHRAVLELSDQIYAESAAKKQKLRWLEVIRGTCFTFMGKFKEAEIALKFAKEASHTNSKEIIDALLGELSHLLYVENFHSADLVAQRAQNLIDENYEDVVYPNIVVTTSQLVIALRLKASPSIIKALIKKVELQSTMLPADQFYADIAKIYLAKSNDESTEKMFSRLKDIMGSKVPASYRIQKALDDRW